MDVNFKNAIVSYRQLEIFSFLKGKPKVKKKWLKKLRRKIVSYFDTEIEFTELYNILKTVEKQGFGFYIMLKRFEATTSDDDIVFFQQVGVCMRYPGSFEIKEVDDVGFSEDIEIEGLTVHNSNIIEPTEIINVSNSQILNEIEIIDKDVYYYIFNTIVDYFCGKFELSDEDCLISIITEVLKDYGVDETKYSIGIFENDSVCLEEYEFGWMVYIGKNGEKEDIKYHLYSIHDACLDFLERLSDSEEMSRDLKKLLFKKLRKH